MIKEKDYKKAKNVVLKYEKQQFDLLRVMHRNKYLENDINKLICKLHHLICISDSEKAKDAYRYSINELQSIRDGYGA